MSNGGFTSEGLQFHRALVEAAKRHTDFEDAVGGSIVGGVFVWTCPMCAHTAKDTDPWEMVDAYADTCVACCSECGHEQEFELYWPNPEFTAVQGESK